MNRTTTLTLWSYLLTILLAVSVGSAQEQTALRLQCSTATSTLRANTKALTGFGYADRNESPSFIGIGRTNIYLSAYILLPDAGANKIEKISFPAATADKDAYLLVLSEDGQTTLYNEPCEITAGVNEMTLKTPFVTEAGKRYLVGFATKVVAENERDTYVLPFDKKEDIDEALYVGIGTDPFPTSTNQNEFGIQYVKGNKLGSAFIFVTLQDNSMSQNTGYMMSATGTFKRNDRNIPLNEKQSVKISLRNLGLNPITSFEFSYQFGSGEVKSIAHNLTTALAPGKTEEYTFEIPAEVEGMGALHLAVPKINDKTHILATRRLNLPYRIGEILAIGRETVLIERFTGEACPYCPQADAPIRSLIKKLQAAGLRVSYIAYHNFKKDFLSMEESYKLGSYFLIKGFPSISINRTVTSADGSLTLDGRVGNAVANTWKKEVKSDKQGVKIERISQSIVDGKLTAVIGGVALKHSFDPEDLYLTVIVTEDNIPSRYQAGASSSYKHEAAPRLFLTAPTGDKLKVNADGTFTVTLEGTLNPSWARNQCKVVAIVHPSITQANKSFSAIHTAETALLGCGLANEPIAPTQAPIVTAEEGYLNIQGRVDAFELYDMSGVLVSTTVEKRLEPGVYVIRIFSDLHTYTSKVVVR